ncbi:BnaC03g23710D [Brassica napus]|uniref:BnaC03g23710D protein n=1 Tax=Brassica napus TaxID=3708 RepID=A0A078GB35_BRANA|nr:BnaC03g23710D [Brassica napus]
MAQLPPQIPNMTPHWPDFSQKLSHFSTAAASSAFLDFSACSRGNHRRSISDSIAFLEAPIVTSHMEEHNFDKFDDEQFMSMFTEDDDDLRNNRSHNNKNVGPNNNNNRNDEVRSQCKTEPEDGTASSNNSGDSSSNRIIDPKRVKRILANRQSAQRSRVRKLQYISELERSVTSLQSEVSVLSPRVAFLDHQRLLLNVDNSALKQRIAALAQDKIFKDAHQESLKREIERLRQVYQQQSFKKMENANHSPETGVDIKLSIEKEQMLNI